MVFKKGQIAWNKGKSFSEESREKMRESQKRRWNDGEKSDKLRENLRKIHLGVHQSKETIKKRTDKTRGKKRSPEQCKRISESVMGRVPWIKGKYHSEETKQKMRKNNARAMLGKHQSDEMKNKIRLTHLGRHRSEETKKRLSESHLGEKNPMWGKPAYNRGLNLSGMLGKHHTGETKRKIGEKNSGKHPSEETKRRLREINLGKHLTKETKEKISIANKKLFKDEQYAKKIIETLRISPNRLELYLDFLLQNYFPDEWKFVGDGQVVIQGLCPDFINVNGKKQIIELFGEHWHTGNNVQYRRTEEGRKKIFAQDDYSTLVIWSQELADENKIIEKIRSFSQ